jgi:dihydroneopterin aldolase
VDVVFIRGLRVDTVIGVYEWERGIRQTVVLDIEMGSDTHHAASSDRIGDALDYAAVSASVHAFIEASEFQLLETMAEQVAQLIMHNFNVPWLRLGLSKPGAVAEAESVGVIIERGERT